VVGLRMACQKLAYLTRGVHQRSWDAGLLSLPLRWLGACVRSFLRALAAIPSPPRAWMDGRHPASVHQHPRVGAQTCRRWSGSGMAWNMAARSLRLRACQLQAANRKGVECKDDRLRAAGCTDDRWTAYPCWHHRNV